MIAMRRRHPGTGRARGSRIVVAGLVTALMLAVGSPATARTRPTAETADAARATSVVSTAATARMLPPANATFDYQIGGAYTPASSVRIVDRDRLDAPVRGRYNVCYVNAFQTQTAEAAWWKTHHRDLLLRRADGSYVVDGAWNEILLDTSTAAKRRALLAIVGRWIDGCRSRGFQAVEPDNLDSWTRSKSRLSRADNIAFARLLVARAHADHLAIAQKNDTSMAPVGRSIGFDFAIVEECQVYSECGAYTRTYGRLVYEIEYVDNGGAAGFARACSARGRSISIVYRDRDVLPRGSRGYVYRAC